VIRKTFKISSACLLFGLHLLAGIFLLAIALVIVLFWQFSKGPIDMTFAAAYIKDAFAAEGQQVSIGFDKIVASWPNLQGTPSINFINFAIIENNEEKLKVSEANIQLAILPLLIGKISPETITLVRPVIRMMRDTDGEFRLFLTSENNALPNTEESRRQPTLREVGESLFLGSESPVQTFRGFKNLKAVNIRNAELITEDYLSGATWIVPDISLYLQRGPDNIDVSLNYVVPGHTILSALNGRIHRDKKKNTLEYSADLRNVDLTLLARNFTALDVLQGQTMVLNGVVQGVLSQKWTVQTAVAAVRSPEGRIRLGTALDRDFSYKDLMINLDYDRAAQKLSLSNTSMQVNGTKVSITAERKTGADGKRYLPLTLRVPELTLDQIKALWPEEYRDTNAGVWLTRDLSGATLRNVNITANIPEAEPEEFSSKDIEASFDYENLKVDYRAPLIPATETKGRGTIKEDVLDIKVDSGKIADLQVSSARIVITELGSDLPGEVNIDVNMNGPISTVFDYISMEPISLGETLRMDPSKVKGNGDFIVNVSFPTSATEEISIDDVKVTVDATLRDTLLPGIVRGLDLTGGPLALKVAEGAFTISGKGLLDGIPVDLIYSEYIDPATAPYVADVKAKLITTKKLRDTFGVNLDEFAEGDLPAEIHYKEIKRGDVTVDVKLDVTPAKMFLEPFNFVKPVGVAGTATAVAVLKDDKIQQIKNIEVVMGADKASGGIISFGQLGKEWDVKSGSFSSIVLGKDNQFSLSFTQPAYKKLKFNVNGAKVDGRSFLSPDATPASKSSTSSVSAEIKAGVMRTGNAANQIIKNPNIKAEVNPEGDITSLDIAASIGAGPFSLTIKPDAAGRMKLRMRAADAGATLHALDVYSNMLGGELIVDGMQTTGGKINDIRGAATIRNFVITDAPVLAKLMNGLSLGGINEIVKGKGIAFTRLRMNYIWKETKEGRVISITDGRTSGAAIGLSFGGIVNQTKGTMDISGTFVPMSGVNKFVSSIPLVGKLLTGGKGGGIIAATYAIKGPSEDPRVFVNPLSVLAPGFLRSILFEGGMRTDEEFDDDAPPATRPAAERSQYN
jgi:hypothetical protein